MSSPTWFDGHALVGLPPRGSLAERERARRIVAGYALGADDLRQLLDVIGLWPSQDEEAIREPPTVWGSGYIRRRGKRIP